MEPRHLFAAVALVSLFNGLFSPFAQLSWSLAPFLFPLLLEGSQGLVVMVGVLMLAIATLVVSGLPAALYERVTGTGTTTFSMGIWLGAALLLSLPTVLAFLAVLSRP